MISRAAASFARLSRSSVAASAPLAAPALLAAQNRAFSTQKAPVRVAVTGAAGQIGYSLLFRIASGEMLGKDQPVILQCIELPNAMDKLQGTIMELEDCAFPLVKSIIGTSDINQGFGDADYIMLVGSRPRGPGMERKDLLQANGAIFTTQGKAINANAKKTTKVIVVGNPANTNCLIAAHHARDIPPENFTAMTRLDHNRALAQVAIKTKSHVTDIQKLCIWGNHSSTQYPDVSFATIRGKSAKSVINDEKWISDVFIPTVQQRGAAIIKARGVSSAASAAGSAIDHMRDWALGTSDWTSMAVPSTNDYGIGPGVYFSYPVICKGGKYEIVKGLVNSEFSKQKIELTKKELFEERDMVRDLLQ